MIHPFALHRPATVQQASELLRELPDAAFLCGGTELLQVMKMGLARFEHLVDLKAIPELRGIEHLPDGSVRIGATTTHRELERSEQLAEWHPAFVSMAREIANQRVRNVGTIGGNLCFAEPHSDPATLLLAMDARLEVASADAERELGIDEFVLDALTTALEPDELLVAVRMPAPAADEHVVYRRLAFVERPVAAVGCKIMFSAGTVKDARVAVGSIGEVPVLVKSAARELIGRSLGDLEAAGDRAADAIRDECEASDDVGGSAEYKRHLAATLLRRALRQVRDDRTHAGT
jgi:aerobic carbon-monoxide dehydrogenase medium subunit